MVKGQLTIQRRDSIIKFSPGEMYIVPKGVEYCPIATEETHFIMIEPKSTLNTGSIEVDISISNDKQKWM
ncbi:hypothetical protein [Pseudoalteromonas sp. G4]|uniref:hypothetical protein n=1 Tax=Pseudoalteromonas sp. G4 TaxID=2992761 RepID=UPI00237D981D|nr:hypothetical protein [Pseudoalteromonas sp. G4]MDE3274306.1 hypothetical protein [Pseudoalteromonas sp. G4]